MSTMVRQSSRPRDSAGAGLAESAATGAHALAPYVAGVQAEWRSLVADQLWWELEGTFVMADVSGFTPLAERLARHGKVGAEELTDILNGVFRRLLAVCSSLGGDCLKFGGDALFLLFTGPGHAERACAAAATMGETVRTTRHHLRSVHLDMSLGVHSGRCHLFHVGRSHLELVVAGPAATKTLEMETLADAGEVLVSADTAARLDPGCLGPAKGEGWLLRRPPEVTPRPLAPPPAGFDPTGCLPVALRAHLGTIANQGEHRLAVIAFVAFSGTDGLVDGEGPAAAAAALDELVARTQEACDRHGVTFLATDVYKDGGKIILATGMPSAVPDGEDRMLLALIEILAVPSRLTVRAGVNRGRVFSVDLGGTNRRTYTVIGDEVNLAARVAFKAEPGQVVATDAELARARTRFRLSPLEPFRVKGKSEPISAQVVGTAQHGEAQVAMDLLPLVGRDTELGELRQALAAARASRGRIVELVGEPGIGKSRLLAELLRQAGELPVLRVEGGQYGRNTPYFALWGPLRRSLGLASDAQAGAVAGALRARVASLDDGLLPWLPLLAVPFGLALQDTPESAGVDAAFRRARMHAVTVEFLEQLFDGPLLLAIEDAHWLDQGTTDLLQQLLMDVSRKPWAVVVTRRDQPEGFVPSPSEARTTLRLAPLDVADAERLVSAATDAEPLPAHVLAGLVERSAGNPLFLQELVTAASSTSGLSELPDSVEAIMAATVDTLEPTDRAVLRSAAVLGARFRIAELAAILDDTPPGAVVQDVLDRLQHFLVADGADRLRFRHVLLRDVAYEGLPFRTRRLLHGRAGRFIEAAAGPRAEEVAELLSLHFHIARLYDKAWDYSRIAARRAHHNGALHEAVVFYQRANEAARRRRDIPAASQAEVAEWLGDVCEISARYADAAAAYRQARRLQRGREVALARLCRKEGWVRERSDRYSDALRWYTRGFQYLETVGTPDDEASRARAELIWAQGDARLRQGRYRAAIALLSEAADQAERLGDRATLADAYTLLYWAHSDLGDAEAATYQSLALPIFEELGDHHGQAKVLGNTGDFLYYAGRWDEAVDCWQRSSAAYGRSGDVVGQAMTANNIGEILRDRGRLAEAEEQFRVCLRVARAANHPLAIAYVLANLGLTAARAGRADEAAGQLDEARRRLVAIGADPVVVETNVKEVERRVLVGTPDALELAEATLLEVQKMGGIPALSIPLHRLAGYALAQQGRFAEARARFEASLREAEGAEAQFEAALTFEAMLRLDLHTGAAIDVAARTAEVASRLALLGVVATPEVPLPAPAPALG